MIWFLSLLAQVGDDPGQQSPPPPPYDPSTDAYPYEPFGMFGSMTFLYVVLVLLVLVGVGFAVWKFVLNKEQ
jgi:hypothetical protein